MEANLLSMHNHFIVVTSLEAIARPCPNRVEVDVGHAGHQRPLIEQRLTLEAPFPETAGTAVFSVGSSRYLLVEATHEPANVLQAITPQV